jgi:hypothetical protein
MDFYIIIYPGGDKTKLYVTSCFSYEKDEYDIASRRTFREGDEEELISYTKSLAEKHGLECEFPSWMGVDIHEYLD